jgi:hypothetical protein
VNRELQLKRPAEVTAYQPPTLPAVPEFETETLIGSPAAITKELARLQARGELAGVSERLEIKHGEHAGKEAVKIGRRDPRPRWAKRCLVAGLILAPFGGLMAAGLWLLASLTAEALALFCGLALLGLAALLRSGGGSRQTPGVTVTVTTTVIVR